MAELVERYVHQVGRYLPPNERAEIEVELRSQIQDQLDDRFEGAPSPADVASVLAEFGHPHQMAASYNRERYLVGPDLYPFMLLVLRYVWVLVPTIVIFLNTFGIVITPTQTPLINLIVETVLDALQATLIFSAIAVLLFAFIQRVRSEIDAKEAAFNPLNLPKVDDPYSVDRFESVFGLVFGTIVTLVLLYFLRVGGLTLRFNLGDPGDIIPVSLTWLALLIASSSTILLLHLWVLRRNRWTIALWLTETVLEVFGMICLYFVLYEPLFTRIVAAVPALAGIPGIDAAPEIFVVITALISLLSRGSKLVDMLNTRNRGASPYSVQMDG